MVVILRQRQFGQPQTFGYSITVCDRVNDKCSAFLGLPNESTGPPPTRAPAQADAEP